MSFKEFLMQNCNSTIIVSFLVFKLLSLSYDEIFNPILVTVVDPQGSLRQQSYSIGNQQIRYGVFLTYLLIFLLLVYSIYFVSSTK